MRILFFVYNSIDSCSFYRSGGIASDLEKKLGCEIEVKSLKDSVFHWQQFMRYDLVMMQRPYTQEAAQMASYVKKLRKPLWVDHDDLLTSLPRENRMSHVMTNKAKNTFREILQMADVVSVTTEAMAAELKEFNKNTVVIPNAHNDITFGTERSKLKRNNIILWRGSDTHVRDIFLYADDLSRLIQFFPSHTFVFAGFDPWMIESADNLEILPTTDPLLYFQTMRRLAPKVLHVPLQDILFNRCKSNIAWMEAAYFGAACVAPMIEEWVRPGALNYTSGDDYSDWIRSAIIGELDIEKYVNISWEYICDNLLLSKVNEKRVELIKNLVK